MTRLILDSLTHGCARSTWWGRLSSTGVIAHRHAKHSTLTLPLQRASTCPCKLPCGPRSVSATALFHPRSPLLPRLLSSRLTAPVARSLARSTDRRPLYRPQDGAVHSTAKRPRVPQSRQGVLCAARGDTHGQRPPPTSGSDACPTFRHPRPAQGLPHAGGPLTARPRRDV